MGGKSARIESYVFQGGDAGGGVLPRGGVLPPSAGAVPSASTCGAGGAVTPLVLSPLLPLTVGVAGEGGITSSSSDVESSDAPTLSAEG